MPHAPRECEFGDSSERAARAVDSWTISILRNVSRNSRTSILQERVLTNHLEFEGMWYEPFRILNSYTSVT